MVCNAMLLERQYGVHKIAMPPAYNYVQRMQVPPYIAHVQVCMHIMCVSIRMFSVVGSFV